MKLINKYYINKRNYAKAIILIHSGIFYETLNNDAYIMNYLFDYKIKKLSNCIMVGFPESNIKNITNRFIKENIWYVILDDNSTYVSNKIFSFEDNYDILLNESKKSYNKEKEIMKINEQLLSLKEDNNINKIIQEINNIISINDI